MLKWLNRDVVWDADLGRRNHETGPDPTTSMALFGYHTWARGMLRLAQSPYSQPYPTVRPQTLSKQLSFPWRRAFPDISLTAVKFPNIPGFSDIRSPWENAGSCYWQIFSRKLRIRWVSSPRPNVELAAPVCSCEKCALCLGCHGTCCLRLISFAASLELSKPDWWRKFTAAVAAAVRAAFLFVPWP